MLAADVIEEVHTPSDWVSPIVVVPKKEGSEVRICVDMRRANEAVRRIRYPFPNINEMLTEVSTGSKFSRLDMNLGFHQIELHPDSRSITTFVTPFGIFRYKRLMFGINAAPEIYHNIISQILSDCEGAINYMDDILVFGKDENEHQ